MQRCRVAFARSLSLGLLGCLSVMAAVPPPGIPPAPAPLPPPAAPAAFQPPATGSRALSLQECLELALQHNLDVQIERVNPEIERYNLSLVYAGYDPGFTLQYTHRDSTDPGTYDPNIRQIVPGSESESDTFSAGLSGLLPSGADYNIGLTSLTDSYGTRFPALLPVPFESSQGSLRFGLTQPLLKDLWIDRTRMNVRVGRKSIQISELALAYRIMAIAAQVEQAYYDLIYARENVIVQEKALQLAERLLSENKQRVKVGAMAPLDEKQAESQVAARRADVIGSQRTLATQQNTLKNLLSDDYAGWGAQTIVPSERLEAFRQLLDLQDSWSKGLAQRPDLRELQVQLEQQDIVLRFNRNQLLPQLDLTGSYGLTGVGDEFSDALGGISRADGPNWSVGAIFSIPLSNRAARETYRRSQVEKRKLLLGYKKAEQSIMLEIDNALKLAQSNFERIDATQKAREFAEAALDAEQKKLENGKSTSFVVLQLQRDLTVARLEEISALAQYNKSLSELALAEGSILERHRIDIQSR